MNENMIYQFLDGELTGQALADIEQRINTDSQFAEQVDLVRDMRSFGIRRHQEIIAKKAIQKVGQQYNPQSAAIKSIREKPVTQQSVSRRRLYLLPLTAAAVVLLGLFIKQTMTSDLSNPENIYAQYAAVSPLSFSTRQAKTDESLLQAQTYFNAKNYRAALPHFKTILEENPNNAKAMFYQGYAKVASGDHQGGRSDLESLLSNSLFEQTAKFHIALSFLKTSQLERAKVLLAEIPERSSHYSDAQEVLAQI